MIPAPVSDDEKRAALARVLDSRAFSRSDQLRAFLRYVCEAELAGRAQQLNEYALGVSVLGRPEGYSPAEDSSVRSRAYELRNKLKSYYQDEAPDDPIRIEIDKGAYVPRFQRREATPQPAAASPPEPASMAVPAAHGRRVKIIAATIGCLFSVAVMVAIWLAPSPTRPPGGLAARVATPEMEAFWKPFLDPDTPLLISFEIRMFLFAPATGLVVRDF